MVRRRCRRSGGGRGRETVGGAIRMVEGLHTSGGAKLRERGIQPEDLRVGTFLRFCEAQSYSTPPVPEEMRQSRVEHDLYLEFPVHLAHREVVIRHGLDVTEEAVAHGLQRHAVHPCRYAPPVGA